MGGIYFPGTVHDGQFRVLAQEIGCSRNEAVGIVVTLWMIGNEIADTSGTIQKAEYGALNSISESIPKKTVFRGLAKAGFITVENDVIVLTGFAEAQLPYRRLVELETKETRKRELDTARKRKRRAEIKAEQPKPKPKKTVISKSPSVFETAVPVIQEQVIEDNKPKLDPKPKVKKERYAEFVLMTKEQHQKLVDAYGQAATEEAIRILDNYKGSKGKKYKDDYRAILSWVMNALKERKPELFQRDPLPDAQWHETNPFE